MTTQGSDDLSWWSIKKYSIGINSSGCNDILIIKTKKEVKSFNQGIRIINES